jgi:hypothetical protein
LRATYCSDQTSLIFIAHCSWQARRVAINRTRRNGISRLRRATNLLPIGLLLQWARKVASVCCKFRSIWALSQLDLTVGEYAKINLTPSRWHENFFSTSLWRRIYCWWPAPPLGFLVYHWAPLRASK